MKLSIDQWQVDADVEATRDVYHRASRGAPANCSCAQCRNFAALGDSAFPPSFRELAGQLGIDYHKAVEVFDFHDFRDGQTDYGGWFHFIGTIQEGPAEEWSGACSQWPWNELTHDFKIVIGTGRHMAFREFGDRPLVQITFDAREPWVLPEAYPHLIAP